MQIALTAQALINVVAGLVTEETELNAFVSIAQRRKQMTTL